MQGRCFALLHFSCLPQPHMKTLINWWPSAIVIAVIIYATWVPHPLPEEDIPLIPHIDKIIHAIMMGGLTGALMFDYYRSSSSHRMTVRTVIFFTAIAMAFSIVDETVQGLLPIGRPSDVVDLFADWLGCVVAAFTAPPAVRAVVRRR